MPDTRNPPSQAFDNQYFLKTSVKLGLTRLIAKLHRPWPGGFLVRAGLSLDCGKTETTQSPRWRNDAPSHIRPPSRTIHQPLNVGKMPVLLSSECGRQHPALLKPCLELVFPCHDLRWIPLLLWVVLHSLLGSDRDIRHRSGAAAKPCRRRHEAAALRKVTRARPEAIIAAG